MLVDASSTATAKHAPQAVWSALALAHAVESAMGRRRIRGEVALGPVGVAAPVADSGPLGTAIGDGEGERSTRIGTGKLASRTGL